MTTSEILNLNDITFSTVLSPGFQTPTRVFLGGGPMETFFFFFKSPETIEEEVIPVIDHYINGNSTSIDNDLTVGGGDYVEVHSAGVKFIDRDTLTVQQTVPLDQFKVIAQAWADYNKTTPFV